MWTLDRRRAVPAWRADAPPDVVLAFSTRLGGVSEGPYRALNLGRSTEDRPEAIEENRRRLLASLDLDAARLATAGQVHGTRVAGVTAAGLRAGCDGLVTTEPGLALAVTGADCVPLLYHAPGAVAVVHSGWRGTRDGAPEAGLAAVCAAADCGPERVTVHLGPCIRACCYEVGPEVARDFPVEAVDRGSRSPRLDLPLAARLRLRAAGLPEGALFDTGACTACEAETYFSHRRDRGRTGRQWGLAAIRVGAR
jgi:hypothetical protein